jgi:hypothetical protein
MGGTKYKGYASLVLGTEMYVLVLDSNIEVIVFRGPVKLVRHVPRLSKDREELDSQTQGDVGTWCGRTLANLRSELHACARKAVEW